MITTSTASAAIEISEPASGQRRTGRAHRSLIAAASASSRVSTRARPGEAPRGRSYQVVEDLLDVLVLIEAVDELQHLGHVLFGELHGSLRDELGLGRDRRDLP